MNNKNIPESSLADETGAEQGRGFHRRDVLSAMAGFAVTTGLGLWPTATQANPCINANDGFLGPRGDWRVFRLANPPVDDSAATASNFGFWPGTDMMSRQSTINGSSWTGGKVWFFVWANRAISAFNQKPNPIQSPAPVYQGLECRVQYTSVAKANAATQSLIRYWLGVADYMAPWIQAGGQASDFVFYADLLQYPQQYFDTVTTAGGTSYQVMTDRPWLPSTPGGGAGTFTRATAMNGNPSLVAGIVLDYEVADGRPTSVAVPFFRGIYTDIKSAGAELFIYTDPLDRLQANQSGLDYTNLPTILKSYTDHLTIMLWGNNQQGNVASSYKAQISVLKGRLCSIAVPFNKLAILFDLNTTSRSDAQFVNNILKGSVKTRPQTIVFWADGADEGGACGTRANNQIIACLKGSRALGRPVAPTASPASFNSVCNVR